MLYMQVLVAWPTVISIHILATQQEAPDLLALYHSLDGRVKQLEDAIASGMAASGSSERSGIPSVLELSRE